MVLIDSEMEGKSCSCRCLSITPLVSCFFICSFLFVAAFFSFSASPYKIGFLFAKKGTFGSYSHDYDVWPSLEFWRNFSLDGGRQMRNTCSFSGCQQRRHPTNQSQSQFKHPFNARDECPFYFRYIREDLSPWAPPTHSASPRMEPHDNHSTHNSNSVSKQMLDKAVRRASFRVVIKKGRLYVHSLRACFQTRSIFTIWGLLQLLQFYPGLVPDVDMLFGCGDTPEVFRRLFTDPLVSPPPPVFQYCSTPLDYDIPFPDWTFWGWPEVHLRPWDAELYGILKGGNELLWEERHPTAFWKGNTDTGGMLRKLLKTCHGPTIVHQNWYQETTGHFKNSKLSQQCKHRYKIYAEGWGWSVSLKYIMACDSPTFVIDPVFHDFYSRGLVPLKHFWPVNRNKLCNSIEFATDWGNNNPIEAEAIGRAGRQYITKEVSLKHVYDYMLHVLHEYSKLLDFEPVPGPKMEELCIDAFLCQTPDVEKVLYRESLVEQPSEEAPCFLPARDEALIQKRHSSRLNITQIVRNAEKSAGGAASLKAQLHKGKGMI